MGVAPAYPSNSATPLAFSKREALMHSADSSFHLLDYLALVGYLLVLVWIGFHFARREKSTQDFFLAGRRIPWWAATLSIFSTLLSALTFMAIPAKAFAEDWSTILINVGIILVAPVTVFGLLPFFRRLQVTTIYEYLELRFGPGLRVYGSLAFVSYQLARMGVLLLLPAMALSTVTGFDVRLCIGVMGVLCILYTVLGGIEAVIWTDVLQSVVLLGGGLLCILQIVVSESFDLGGMLSTAYRADKLHIFHLEPGFDANASWVLLVGGFFVQLVPFTSDQALAQRFLTTPTEKAAAKSVWAHAVMVVPASLLFFGLGTALFVFYQSRPEMLPPSERNDIIVPWFFATQLPAGLAGLVIAGLFAATMSSVDSGMHSIATTLVHDVYGKICPRADDKARLLVARLVTFSVGLCGTLSALWMYHCNQPSLWDYSLMLTGLLGSSLAGVFLLGVWTTRAHAVGTAMGVAASVAMLIAARYIEPRPFPDLLTALVGVLTCVGVGYLASRVLRGQEKPLSNLTLHTLDSERPSA